jgi:hypothetical protein
VLSLFGCRTPPSCQESHLPGVLKRVYFTHWRAVLLAAGPERLRVENWNFRASGLIGNVLFADRYLVVIAP